MTKYKGNARKGGGNQGIPNSYRGAHKDGCCSYQEAGKALLRGKARLAVRYIRLDVKARLGII